jgi:hypothetical protein
MPIILSATTLADWAFAALIPKRKSPIEKSFFIIWKMNFKSKFEYLLFLEAAPELTKVFYDAVKNGGLQC